MRAGDLAAAVLRLQQMDKTEREGESHVEVSVSAKTQRRYIPLPAISNGGKPDGKLQ